MHLSERGAGVIGSDEDSVDMLADILAEFAAVEVDRLDLSSRSLHLVARREYGLVVIDTQLDDPVAFTNELSRRLSVRRARDCAVVVCHSGGALTPGIEALARRLDASCVARPFDSQTFMDAVTAALESEIAVVAS